MAGSVNLRIVERIGSIGRSLDVEQGGPDGTRRGRVVRPALSAVPYESRTRPSPSGCPPPTATR